MNHDVYLSDNVGNRVPPGVASGAPKLASGQTITDATTGGDHYDVTLTPGKTYKIMADATGGWLFGVAAVTSAANVLWFCPPSGVMCFTMPLGYTALHYECLVNSGNCYLVEMDA
jgi:hypothetical protein